MKRVAWFLSLSFLVACAPFQDSPFSDQLLRSARNLNILHISRLSDMDADGVLRIAVFADSHQNYEDLDRVINAINLQSHVDFVVNLGDFTNTAYNIEYNQFLDSYLRIYRPSFTVIGNHDAIGAGPSLFKKAFGTSNFWFESDNKRFVFFHSANWEDPEGFDPSWLKSVVDSSTKKVIIFSHVSLRDPERFHGLDAQIFDSVINDSKVQMVLNGHNHVFLLRMDHDTVMLQSPRVEGVRWLLLDIQGNNLSIKRMDTGEVIFATLKP